MTNPNVIDIEPDRKVDPERVRRAVLALALELHEDVYKCVAPMLNAALDELVALRWNVENVGWREQPSGPFKLGDVVRLKTGGQMMTVENVGQFMRALHDTKPVGIDSAIALEQRGEQAQDDSRTVWCVWFAYNDNSGPHRGRFHPETLVRAEPATW